MSRTVKLKQKYAALNPRERRALSLLSVFLIAVFVYFVMWKPVTQWAAKNSSAYVEKKADYDWMNAHATEAKTAAASAKDSKTSDEEGSILARVDKSASSFHIPLKKIESEGNDKVHIWTEGASFDQVLLWLESLNKNSGVVVNQIRVERQDLSGSVNLNIILATRN